jgi:two-component system, NarL family, sensor kinase
MNENDSILSLVFIISAFVLLVFISFIIFSVINQQRKITRWQLARIAAEIQTLENERKRIAGDLHDELGPLLSAVKMQINHLEPSDETETVVLEKSSKQIDGIIQRFREISYNLLPNTLVRKGFIKATYEFIEKIKSLHTLKIEFHANDFSITPEAEINLYRVVQEIIQNTLKHARATFLKIDIIKNEKIILLTTQDDGIGFNYNEKSLEAKGIGLLSLQSRVQLLQGQLIVNTKQGSGTIFKIEIPVL